MLSGSACMVREKPPYHRPLSSPCQVICSQPDRGTQARAPRALGVAALADAGTRPEAGARHHHALEPLLRLRAFGGLAWPGHPDAGGS